MADKKISALTDSTTAPAATDVIPTVENMGGSPATKRKAWSVWLAAIQTSLQTAPAGTMWNGQIVTSVASNNLTVALKTMAGTDATAANPIIVRVGNTLRLITAALSVTKNAGTNYFNSGSAELATLEVDYFVYVGYNATDGITLGFSRLPYATTYGDFNTTNTNDRYCAISNITTAASTDVYELVGRFNAILSATANFFWSIPGTSIIVNHPITDTRWLTWTPTVTSGAGTYTTVVKACRYQISYNRVSFSSDITVSNKGTASGFMALTPPITITSVGGVGGNEYVATSGKAISALISVGSNAIIETLYDATTLWTNTWEPMILGFYRLI